jgi:uncharacterized Tic20 family protein
MLCHLCALVGLFGNGIGVLLGPLVVWLLKKHQHPFINEHGREAVNFQITMVVAALVSLVLTFVVIGFLLLIVIGISVVVFPVIGAIQASKGEPYRYPFAIRLIQ